MAELREYPLLLDVCHPVCRAQARPQTLDSARLIHMQDHESLVGTNLVKKIGMRVDVLRDTLVCE